MHTGDDCISIGPGTRNLLMTNIKCGPGHGVRYVRTCIYIVQIKTKVNVFHGTTIQSSAKPYVCFGLFEQHEQHRKLGKKCG